MGDSMPMAGADENYESQSKCPFFIPMRFFKPDKGKRHGQ